MAASYTAMNGLTVVQTVVTLAAATSTPLLAARSDRRYLAVMNTNTSPATLGFTSSAVVAGQGWALGAAPAAGGQGGSMVWDGAGVPTNEVRAISTAGTTLVVLEGW